MMLKKRRRGTTAAVLRHDFAVLTTSVHKLKLARFPVGTRSLPLRLGLAGLAFAFAGSDRERAPATAQFQTTHASRWTAQPR
jgi:hypothetical protein